jgi:hypothetical protein
MIFGETFRREASEIGGTDGEAGVTLRIAELSAGEVSDGGRIDPAGEEAAQRDIRDELATDGLAKIVTAGFGGLKIGEGLDLGRVMRGDE